MVTSSAEKPQTLGPGAPSLRSASTHQTLAYGVAPGLRLGAGGYTGKATNIIHALPGLIRTKGPEAVGT